MLAPVRGSSIPRGMGLQAGTRRSSPRVALAVEVTLMRAHGNPVVCRTQDLGPSGMRVAAARPLAIDELLDFALAVDGIEHVGGHARVVREHVPRVYGMRFEHLSDEATEHLRRLVDRAS
jgi:hypothetical protein